MKQTTVDSRLMQQATEGAAGSSVRFHSFAETRKFITKSVEANRSSNPDFSILLHEGSKSKSKLRSNMNRCQAEGKLRQFNAKIKQEWGELPDDEITQAELAELSERILQRYINSKERSSRQLDEHEHA